MARLPQQYAPLIYGIIQAAITTAVATAIATHQLTNFNMRFVEEWLFAWGVSFLTMLPVVVFVAPLIQRCVLADGVYCSRCLELTRHQRPLLPQSLDLVMSLTNRRGRRRAPSLDVGAPMSCMNGWVFAAAHRSANGRPFKCWLQDGYLDR